MDSTYDELLSKKEISVLDSLLLKYLHTHSDNVKIKPSYLTRVISEKIKYQLEQEKMYSKLITKKYLDPTDFDELVFISEEPMDITLLKRAVKKGYDIIGLDNRINFQFDTTNDSLTLKQQAEQMISIFENNQLDDLIRARLEFPLIDSLKDAYYEQDCRGSSSSTWRERINRPLTKRRLYRETNVK